MKFNNPKESEAKATESKSTITVEVRARELSVIQMRSNSFEILKDFMELLNQGSIFAEHCSLIHGIGGIEGVLILRSILGAVELEADTSALDNMLLELEKSDASELQFLMIDYTDNERAAADATFKAYLRSLVPTTKDATKSPTKGGSITDLISAIEAALNLKGKK